MGNTLASYKHNAQDCTRALSTLQLEVGTTSDGTVLVNCAPLNDLTLTEIVNMLAECSYMAERALVRECIVHMAQGVEA
jgi:hypothetical protein